MTAAVVIVVCGIVTFALRASVVLALGRRTLPPGLQRATSYVMPATMSALTASALAPAGGRPEPALVIVGAAGAIVAVRTRSVTWTIGAGLAVYAILAVTSL
jgi:branched-subunit amino acid transport protein